VTPEQAFSYPLNSFTRVLVQCFIDGVNDGDLAGDLDAGGPGSGEA
jgi:hypothetical protein